MRITVDSFDVSLVSVKRVVSELGGHLEITTCKKQGFKAFIVLRYNNGTESKSLQVGASFVVSIYTRSTSDARAQPPSPLRRAWSLRRASRAAAAGNRTAYPTRPLPPLLNKFRLYCTNTSEHFNTLHDSFDACKFSCSGYRSLKSIFKKSRSTFKWC